MNAFKDLMVFWGAIILSIILASCAEPSQVISSNEDQLTASEHDADFSGNTAFEISMFGKAMGADEDAYKRLMKLFGSLQ